MASAESNDEDMILHLKRSGELSELGFTSTHFVSNANHEVLIDKLRNVALEAESNAVKESGNNSISFPLRPYAEDCPYYSRTGTCKFGFNCRFNHPVKKSNRVSKVIFIFFPVDLILLICFSFIEIVYQDLLLLMMILY